jgi:hypothetical protein
VVAEIEQDGVGRDGMCYQISSRLGDQDLSAVRRRADSGSAMDVQSGVAGRVSDRLTSMKTEANPKRLAVWPRLGRERTLSFDRCLYCIVGGDERREAGVAVRVNQVPVVPLDSVHDHRALSFEDRRIPIPEPQQVAGRALHICEQQGDRSVWQTSHCTAPGYATPVMDAGMRPSRRHDWQST